MAIDMFLKLGDILGESLDSNHKDEIDVLSFSWGASNTGTALKAGNAGSGKTSFNDLSAMTYVDRASPALLKAVSTGQHFPTAILTVRRAGGAPVEFVKYSLTEVLVTALSPGGSGGEDRLTQSLSLNFAHFKYEYTPSNAKGASGDPIPFEFDIKTDKVVLG